MSGQPQDLFKGGMKIGTLPMIFIRLNEAMNNPRVSISQISTIISEDPGLSSRLLRVVNSSFFGYPSMIDTISQAVVIMGTEQLRDLAMATSLLTMFKGLPADLVNMRSFWGHTIACGIAARDLATQLRESNHERFFLAGILHDIGRMVLFTKMPELAREILNKAKKQGQLLHKIEKDVMGYDHGLLGGSLLQSWKIPSSLIEIVSFHHAPEGASNFSRETAIIHTADVVVHAMQLGHSGDSFVPPLNQKAWALLGLGPAMLQELMERIDMQYKEMVNLIL